MLEGKGSEQEGFVKSKERIEGEKYVQVGDEASATVSGIISKNIRHW